MTEQVVLPIDVVPGTSPPKFQWKQTINAPDGRRVVVDHAGPLPPSVEVAVSRVIAVCKQLLHDNAVLRGQVQGMSDRLTRADNAEEAAELAARGLKRTAATPQPVPPKKGK